MSTPYLKLEDAEGNSYSFPPSFFLTSDPAVARSSIKELLYAHGGRQVGDGFVASRKLTIEGHLRANDAATFETAYRAFAKAVLKDGKLTIYVDGVSRYIWVRRPAMDMAWEHWPNFKNISITYDADFPFWQDASEVSSPHVLAGDDDFTVDASGSDHIILPRIEIASDQGVDVPGIILRNTTDGGMRLVYNNPLFLAGNLLVMDSSEGTIKLNNNDGMEYFVSGSFIRLQPKVNTIYFEGAACTVTVKFRKLYL